MEPMFEFKVQVWSTPTCKEGTWLSKAHVVTPANRTDIIGYARAYGPGPASKAALDDLYHKLSRSMIKDGETNGNDDGNQS